MKKPTKDTWGRIICALMLVAICVGYAITGTITSFPITTTAAPSLPSRSYSNISSAYNSNGASIRGIRTSQISGSVAYKDMSTASRSYQAALGMDAPFYNASTCITSVALSYINGHRQRIKLSQAAACTITFTPPPSGSFSLLLEVDQSTTSPYNGTLTLTGFRVPGGVVPTPTASNGAVDYYNILWNDLKQTKEFTPVNWNFTAAP